MKVPLRGSLRLRLIMGSALAVMLATLLAALFIANLYRIHITDRFETELDHHLSELIAMTSIDSGGTPRVSQKLSDPEFNVEGSGLYWQLDAGDGRIARSPSLGSRSLSPTLGSADWETGRSGNLLLHQRSVRTHIGGHPIIAIISSDNRLLDAQIAEFWSDLAISMAIVALLLIAGAVLLVRFGLAPVQRLGEEVDRLRHGEVTQLDPDVPAEFSPVVERLNALLDGQAQLITRARTQAGNLAHDLRTPLALITNEAEQLRWAGQADSADFLLERCALMQRQIDYHLTRAAAAGTRGAGTLTEVAGLVEQIVDAMKRLHAARELKIETDLPPGLRLPCDGGDLAEILSNLIDNACKWARHRVLIRGGPDCIEVQDDGDGIPADKRELVMTVGTRLDPSKPGTGLGLAATADLIRNYGGELRLGDSPLGGLSARVCFTSVPAPAPSASSRHKAA
ncbi:HAMP domain-containing protein [Sandaracinobacter neustonicus]|uniref:histidine kinase n=1 Tax=Sandaracinobacter neustonicus TaxID=1715348 RepID=A0A501XPP7_9SPHN|nr:ATP-binding protein [Sandaracinobacter neustonicus]TPE62661.1 HAMP domain-containing protein [Sandaracinobacter neustonicus]